jgi:hypothetical protein
MTCETLNQDNCIMPIESKLRELGVEVTTTPPSEASLAHFERDKIGAPLPDDYREFLKTYNGGQFKTVVSYRSLESLYPGKNAFEGIVDSFHGLFENHQIHDLLYAIDCFKEDLPKGCIPIAENIFGDQICIGILGEHRGEIRFWDHDVDASSGTIENLPLIARTLDQFVASFYVKPEHTQ